MAACPESIANQTYQIYNFEVIIIDDGSKTPITPVVSKYHDRLNLTLITYTNRGRLCSCTRVAAKDRKLLLSEPKSGREAEIIFIPKKVADRLQQYVRSEKIGLGDRIFPICYEAARAVVRKAGNVVGIYLRPHDLRRHAATFASRSGVPIEIVSKILL